MEWYYSVTQNYWEGDRVLLYGIIYIANHDNGPFTKIVEPLSKETKYCDKTKKQLPYWKVE